MLSLHNPENWFSVSIPYVSSIRVFVCVLLVCVCVFFLLFVGRTVLWFTLRLIPIFFYAFFSPFFSLSLSISLNILYRLSYSLVFVSFVFCSVHRLVRFIVLCSSLLELLLLLACSLNSSFEKYNLQNIGGERPKPIKYISCGWSVQTIIVQNM